MAPPSAAIIAGIACRAVSAWDFRLIASTRSQTSMSISTSERSRSNHKTPVALTR